MATMAKFMLPDTGMTPYPKTGKPAGFATPGFITLLLIFLLTDSVPAAEPDSLIVRMSLKDCISRALEVSPELDGDRFGVRAAEAKLREAKASRFVPKFEMTQIIGPSPEARGNAVTGRSEWNNLSLFGRTEIEFLQPLYTSGKWNASRDLAAAGVTAREAGLEQRRAEVVKRVKELYYGLLLAKQLHLVAIESRDEVKDARKRLLKKLDEDSEEVSYTDLFKLDTFTFKVDQGLHRVEKELAMARSALTKMLDLKTDNLDLAEEVLEQEKVEIGRMEDYIAQAWKDRPEMRRLTAGVEARLAQVRLARSDYYPQLFVAGQAKFAYAPNRDDQHSPFAKDDFNFSRIGAVFGLKQSLSFGLTASRVAHARFEYQKVLNTERAVRDGIALEVEQAFRELLEAGKNVESGKRALRSSRSWMVAARDAFNIGLGEVKEVIDAVKAYGEMRVEYFRAIFDFNRSIARLDKMTGKEYPH